MVLFSPDLQQQTGSTLQLDQTTMQLDWTRLGWIYFLTHPIRIYIYRLLWT